MRWETLDRYLAGECTAADRAYVERWLNEWPERRRLLEQLAATGEGDPGLRARKAEIWARLERELGLDEEFGLDDA